MSSVFKVVEHTMLSSHIREYARATATIDQRLQLSVKQYIPFDNLEPKWGDVTLIATHGSALPRELYEPLFEEIHRRSKDLNFRIRSIWFADVAHQGASGILNEKLLGNDPSWFDHARDLLAMVNHFGSEMVRPIVGVAHSMGAGQIVLASLMHPRLFSSLMLLEPCIDDSIHTCQGPPIARASTFRREVWGSLEEAAIAAKKNLKHWDERVLQRWFEFGYRTLPTVLHPDAGESLMKEQGKTGKAPITFDTDDWLKRRWEDPEGGVRPTNLELHRLATLPVTLATTKHQEVVSYLRPNFGDVRPASGDGSQSHDLMNETVVPANDIAESVRVDEHDLPDVIGPKHGTSPFYRPEPIIAHLGLPHLRPSVLYLFGGKSPVSIPELRDAKLKRTGVGISGSGGAKQNRVKSVVVPKGTHSLPMERVEECAEAMAAWLEDEMTRWKTDEARLIEMWEHKTPKERATVSAEWVEKIKSML